MTAAPRPDQAVATLNEGLRDGRRKQAYQVIADACSAEGIPLSEVVRAELN